MRAEAESPDESGNGVSAMSNGLRRDEGPMTDSTGFLLAEYQDLYENVMHIEKELFDHMSFYTGLFTATVAASITFIGLMDKFAPPMGLPVVAIGLIILWVILLVIGRIELRMTTELRVSKILFVEGLVQARLYFVDKEPALRNYLTLPVGIRMAPPYLRRQSKDWYQIVYISVMNACSSAALFVCLGLLLSAVALPFVGLALWVSSAFWVVYVVIGVWVSGCVFWAYSYRSVSEYCERYDRRRWERMAADSEYNLLSTELPNWRHRTFGDWVIWIENRRRRKSEM